MSRISRHASWSRVVVATTLAVPVGLLLLAGWLNYRLIERDAFKSAEYTVAALTEHALRTLRAQELVIDFVEGHVEGMSWPRIRSSARLHRLLRQVVARNDDISSIFLVAPDGTTALSSRAFPTPPTDASDRDYFSRLPDHGGLYISQPGVGRVSKEPFFSVARARLNDAGTFDGLIAVSADPRYFQNFYESFLRPSEVASLIRADGTVLARHPALDELVHVLNPTAPLMQALRSESDRGTLAARSSVDDRKRIFAYDRVDRYPLYATFQIATASVWAAWRAAMLPYALACLLALGGLLASIGFAQQHTRRALAEQHQRDAEEASRAKDRFVAALSHEIRNPLSAMTGALELLRRSPASVTMATQIMGRQLSQMRSILDDLLDTARTVFGKIKLDTRSIDLYAFASEILADRVALSDGDVQLTVAGTRAWVQADPVRLRQMIDNLVENAVRYGGRRITISVQQAGECNELVVEDDGQGIPADLLPQLFQPFVQGEQSLERAQGGLGLGLALVSHLARLHGGSVRASSAGAGRGSVFTLRLPVAEAPEQARVPAPPPAATARRRILLVDDEPDARESLRALLVHAGHEVAVASNGLDGLAAICETRPEVALLDIGLPGMDGYEVARRVRASLQGDRPPLLIAITGYGQPRDRELALSAGFAGHLTKPFAFDELLRLIDEGTATNVSAQAR